MRLFEPLYIKALQWAKHRYATAYLGALSFAESSFFPIPPDVMLAPMVLAQPKKGWFYAALTTVTSVLGGLLGYVIGAYFFDVYGDQILTALHAHDAFNSTQAMYKEYGMVIILLAGFTPIPYKIFTIASGVMGIALLPFMLMSLLGRGARFFLVAGLIKLGGEKLADQIQQKVEWLGWLFVALVLVVIVFIKAW